MNAPAQLARELDWFELPAARQILAGLEQGRNCGLVAAYAFYGDDGQRWVAYDDRDELEALRREEVDRIAGYTFESVAGTVADPDSFDDAKTREWLRIAETVPSVSDAVEAEMARRVGREPRVLFKGLVQGDGDAFRKAVA